MEHLKQIAQAEARAKHVGRSLSRVALEAGLYPHMIWRWRRGYVIPKVTTFHDAMTRIDAVLDRIEAEIKSPPA